MPEKLEFKIYGMDCAEEVAILRRQLAPLLDPSQELAFDVLRGKMTVSSQAAGADAKAIQSAVARTGMRAERWTTDLQPGAAEQSFWQRKGRTVLTAASGLLIVAGFLAHASTAGLMHALVADSKLPRASFVLYAAAAVAGGWYVVGRAWRALMRLRPDMNMLMTIAVIGAAVIGQWFEAAVVSFLFAVSLALESWSVGRARRAIEALLAIAPDTARLLKPDGSEVVVAAAEVLPGTHVLVKPGDRFPLDGFVRKGTSTVNQAPITGESMPVEKAPGAEVFAGTINGNGALVVEVTRVAGETTLAQIIRMVGEAQSKRAPSEQWVDRFAQVYTPAVLLLAILVATLPPLLLSGAWSFWVYRALVLLVIGCPCALVISTPVSVVAALAAAARNGVLIKGGAFVEMPARLRVVALDKTGTITRGEPRVTDVIPGDGHSESELLQAMGAIEAHSDHPLARAIMAYLAEKGIQPATAEDVQSVDGRGATARVNGRNYWLGSHRYLEERGQETPAVHDHIEELAATGKSIIIMGTDDHVCGFVTMADVVRPEAAEAIAALRESGIVDIILLTGDNTPTAKRIAAEVGIATVQAELLPADKVAAVEALVRTYGHVAMLGDGVNDAPAMGRATLGIAMGAAGSDAAIEAADIALMSDDLRKLPWLIGHSRRTLSIIRQNVILALGVKLLFVLLTFAGISTLWMAIAADMGVSLAVIANALRLLSIGART